MGNAASHDEEPLTCPGGGAQQSKAHLRDGVVLRPAGPWSGAVQSLLRHLEEAGFAGAPRVVGTGFAEDGREALTFVPGASPRPYAWTDDGVAGVGRLLGDFHAAVASFVPPPDAAWRPWWGRDLPGSAPIIGHCDTGPWNIVARDGLPVALIDWEFAGPVDALWELAHTAWLNAQLHDDDLAERLGLPPAAGRARQLGLLLDAYALERARRPALVTMMIELAVHAARAEAVQYDVTADSTSAVTPSGFPVLWAITWRARSASWMLRNRRLLERATA